MRALDAAGLSEQFHQIEKHASDADWDRLKTLVLAAAASAGVTRTLLESELSD